MTRPTIISAEFETSTGHRLMDYSGKCAHPHGHNYRWIIELAVDIPNRHYGMGPDFSDIKTIVKEGLEIFDHSFVMRNDDPLRERFYEDGFRTVVLDSNPTAENLALLFANALHLNFKNQIPGFQWVNVQLFETKTNCVNVRGGGEFISVVDHNIPTVRNSWFL